MTSTQKEPSPDFNILEADIQSHLHALSAGQTTSTALVTAYLNRIATYDTRRGLNAFTLINPSVLSEAAASDARRAKGLPPRPLEGIPYTLKDSYKYAGLSVTNGSPALEGLMSNEDSAIAEKLRDAGAILLGKTNMPPMAAGGMQRGLYGRAESPYNDKYLTAAFSSGSSNGAATAVASSMCVFGMGSETVSSGRSPASNNALVCYTPSRGVLSCRGLWPLYVTCDVPVPYTRSVGDMLALLSVIATPDAETKGDFWRDQPHVPISGPKDIDYQSLKKESALQGKRIGVPKMYVGQEDSNPHAKPCYVSPEVISLWEETASALQSLGAEIVYTDFPLVTNYENDSLSGETNNVDGAPSDWNKVERSSLIAKAWNDFLVANDDEEIKCLADLKDSKMLFPKPENYVPDTFLEVRNWIDYAGLPALVSSMSLSDSSINDFPGLETAVKALEAQRQRDLEAWMTELNIDLLAFPAQGDVGLADLEFSLESTKHSLQNGVKYSNGNRAIRHLGVPTVSVPMGIMEGKEMPVNVTFAGKSGSDGDLLEYAYVFERGTQKRKLPGLTTGLGTDLVGAVGGKTGEKGLSLEADVQKVEKKGKTLSLRFSGSIEVGRNDKATLSIFVDGKLAYKDSHSTGNWEVLVEVQVERPECLGWDLKPLPAKKVMALVVVDGEEGSGNVKIMWVDVE